MRATDDADRLEPTVPSENAMKLASYCLSAMHAAEWLTPWCRIHDSRQSVESVTQTVRLLTHLAKLPRGLAHSSTTAQRPCLVGRYPAIFRKSDKCATDPARLRCPISKTKRRLPWAGTSGSSRLFELAYFKKTARNELTEHFKHAGPYNPRCNSLQLPSPVSKSVSIVAIRVRVSKLGT